MWDFGSHFQEVRNAASHFVQTAGDDVTPVSLPGVTSPPFAVGP